MQPSNRRKAIQSKANNKLKQSVEMDEEENTLEEVLRMIDSLYEMRFLERISRPIHRSIKEQYIDKFVARFEYLHARLNRIRSQAVDKPFSQNGNVRGKSVMGSLTHQLPDFKKSIRLIENRYAEVFLDGSFKHYRKVAAIYGFNTRIEPINIEEWATTCLDNKSGSEKCC